MDLIQEVRKLLAEVKVNSAISLDTLNPEYPGWIIRKGEYYGIGVPNLYDNEISERFSNVRIWSQMMSIGGVEKNILLLTSDVEHLRHEFASVCAEFADPGKNGSNRETLMQEPEKWWEKWRMLLGNSVQNKMSYSLLGEMIIYKRLIENGFKPKWAALDKSTHDIETRSTSFEVKSTIKRYDSVVSINSQHQLVLPIGGLYLCFCRFEESLNGNSIEDVLCELKELGCNYYQLNIALEKMGFEKGSSARNKKYKLHEARKYKIDKDFPSITVNNFKGDKIPEGIVKIVYDVDLNGLEYERMDMK